MLKRVQAMEYFGDLGNVDEQYKCECAYWCPIVVDCPVAPQLKLYKTNQLSQISHTARTPFRSPTTQLPSRYMVR